MSNPFGIPDTASADFDYSKLSPMLGMIDNDAPDYIGGTGVQRKWNERTMHNCAVLYLGGLVCGGAYGAIEGLRKSPSPALKIRFNSMLNYSAKRGSTTGNMLGVMAIWYAMCEKGLEKSHMDSFTSRNDYFGPTLCGFTGGLLFKCTAGPRGAIVAGLIGAAAVAAIRFTQNTLLPKLGVSQRSSHLLFL
ncbi:Tim23 [Blastocystis sp. ATCC 50177/Nand II]|uniref:Tim23 n=1 Tax=Blastocystis sp. subtype 1 (strain ATCC 50177 / NandII) TaxID=478820 RepID=A0A196SD18_BLAHN|nr:Tim23 [Blastocystis sp. ATCC 50177/Nand II]